ncbi:MAG TPA: hypothetical protein VLN61_09385 [Pseudolabrys sp.]|nr:hypothetical protein [Pseudolabrys sp.]
MQDITAEQSGRKLGHDQPPGRPAEIYIRAQLELFEIRSRQMASKVNAGLISMADASDMLFSAAVWSGLLDNIGADAVQAIMSRSFLSSKTTH